MSAFLKSLFVVGALSLSSAAFAGNGQFYLGGAFNLNDCSRIAGVNGYVLAVFGPSYDDAGNYYPYWNACFGKGRTNGGGGSDIQFYDIRVERDYNYADCAADIEWRVPTADCRVNYSEDLVQCKTRGDRTRDIEDVSCVRRVYRN